MSEFKMRRISKMLRTPRCELRAGSTRVGLWLEARSSRLAVGLVLCAFLVGSGSGLLAEEPDTTITVDVKLVNVFVTVTDARGAPVANLQK